MHCKQNVGKSHNKNEPGKARCTVYSYSKAHFIAWANFRLFSRVVFEASLSPMS